MIRFLNIASGSKGNATLFWNEDTLLLLDMGVCKQALLNALAEANKTLEDISAVIITHEHSDHIKGLSFIPKGCPIYAGRETPVAPTVPLSPLEMFEVGSFSILPLRTSHDALDPLGYVLYSGAEKFVYMTDTGVIPDESLPYLDDARFYIIESNHDLAMLKESKRPEWLKKRIKGDCGHLSNTQSAKYMLSLVSEKTKHIYLAHLSEECNTPKAALGTYEKVFQKAKKAMPAVSVLKQWESTFGGDEE